MIPFLLKAAPRFVQRKWDVFRANMRRIPLIDALQGFALCAWGSNGVFNPETLTHHSYFGRMADSMWFAGPTTLIVGFLQMSLSLLGPPRIRSVMGFLGLWLMLSLYFAVGSISGRIAWGTHALTEFLICLALVP